MKEERDVGSGGGRGRQGETERTGTTEGRRIAAFYTRPYLSGLWRCTRGISGHQALHQAFQSTMRTASRAIYAAYLEEKICNDEDRGAVQGRYPYIQVCMACRETAVCSLGSEADNA